ncbi:High mobility group [Penicillium brevicompactum]|uniref:HMG box protein n=1 Tax=Penicillium brevicompactum TaxID=5074 RepID=UPI002540F534|nr:HMG box protein [Penicillium brevicompactum]KAJ5333210.1 HMG box protein [Penicillium brevicompactum]
MTFKRIPPSPTNSSDGHIHQSFEDSGIYQSYPMMSEDLGHQAMHYGSPPQYYQTASGYTSVPTHGMMIADPAMTPPPTGDEGSPFMGSPSMSAMGSPPQRLPASRARATPTQRVKRKQVRRQKTGRKDSDIGFKLEGPLSQLTASFHSTPIRDMVEWAHRSVEDRLEEVRNKNGKICRPMNAYLLYRSAYTARAKVLVGANNHQIVSKVTGSSWHMEPEDIQRKYQELARIERDNHAAAHPDYKFAPLKNNAGTRRDSGMSAIVPAHLADESGMSDMDSEFGGSTASTRLLYGSHSRANSFNSNYYDNSRDSSPFDGPDSLMIPNYIHSHSNSHWSTTSHPIGMAVVHPSALQGPVSKVEDVSFGPVSPSHEIHYDSSLAGLPGAAHHELLLPQSQMVHGLPPSDMDPRLLSQSGDVSGEPTMTTYASPSPYPAWDESAQAYLPSTSGSSMTPSPAPYPHPGMESAYLPSMHSIETREQAQAWEMARQGGIPEPAHAEYDMWCHTEPSQY